MPVHALVPGGQFGAAFDRSAHAVGEPGEDVAGGVAAADRENAFDRTGSEIRGQVEFARGRRDRVAARGKRGETEGGNIFQRLAVDDLLEFDEAAFDPPGQQRDPLAVRQRQFVALVSLDDLSGGAAVFVPQESQRFIHFLAHVTDSLPKVCIF